MVTASASADPLSGPVRLPEVVQALLAEHPQAARVRDRSTGRLPLHLAAGGPLPQAWLEARLQGGPLPTAELPWAARAEVVPTPRNPLRIDAIARVWGGVCGLFSRGGSGSAFLCTPGVTR